METPKIHPSVFTADHAVIKGNVEIEEDASVWFGAVIRSENAGIHIGKSSNIQDNVTLHTDPCHPLTIGQQVSIGHNAVVHSASIADRVIVGMHATILNGASIGSDSIVAAGALVPENRVFPAGSLIMGVPARAVRQLNEEEKASIADNAAHYVTMARMYRDEM